MESPSGWSPEPGTGDNANHSESIAQEVRRLIAQARAYAQVEGERQKLRARIAGGKIRTIAICGVLALFLLLGFIVAGLVGLIIALAPVIGTWLALGAVLLAVLIVIGILGAIAQSKVKQVKRLFSK